MVIAIGQFARTKEALPSEDDSPPISKIEISIIDPKGYLNDDEEIVETVMADEHKH